MTSFDDIKKRTSRNNTVALSLFGRDAAKLILSGRSCGEIVLWLAEQGLMTSRSTVVRFRRDFVLRLPSEELASLRDEAALPESATRSYAQSLIDTLRMLDSHEKRLSSEVLQAHDDVTRQRRVRQVLRLHRFRHKIRRDLERTLARSEVERARRDATASIGALALKFISSEQDRKEFLAEVGRRQESLFLRPTSLAP